ncbi:MAG: hypothetical protein ACP5KD_04750 [Fervidobacterium sp.]
MFKGANFKVYGFLLTVLVAFLFTLTSCTQGFEPRDSSKIPVTVSVKIPSQSTLESKLSLKPTAFIDNLTKVVLTVKDSSNNVVETKEVTDKTNITFQLQLTPGTYTFEVKGYENDTVIFSGTKENQTIAQGSNNNFTIDTAFVNGTIRTIMEIDSVIWDKYNISFARLTFKKETSSDIDQAKDINFSASSITDEKAVYPGMWNVKFNISLSAKSQYTTPASKDLEKQVVIEVPPAKVREVKFRVYFDSTTNEPEIAVVTTQVSLPYADPVTNLSGTWKKQQNELVLSWDHTSSNATFYIYKEILTQDGDKYYDFVGSTQDKTYTIGNFDQTEYDRINGIAVNAVVDNKESGLVVLGKANIQEFITVSASVTNLKANYDGVNLKLSWDCTVEAEKYYIYKKLTSDNDYTKVAEVTTKTATIELTQSDYDNLDKIAVSGYYQGTEGQKTEIGKSNILPFDGGSGTIDDPYLIRTAWQLQRLNDSAYKTTGKYFKLIADINLNGVNWTPIGTYSATLSTSAFVGALDGNYHKIRNLSFNDSNASNVGLFGYLYNATVTNLTIENVNITAKQYIGALSGSAKNSVITRVGVKEATIQGVNSNFVYGGGLIGDANGGVTIVESFAASVTVSAPNYDNARIGAFVGRVTLTTDANNNTIEKSYAIGIVKFKSSSSSNIGGFIGLTSSSSGATTKTYISQCYAAVQPVNLAGGTNANWKGFVGGGTVVAESPSVMNYFDSDVAQTTSGSSSAGMQTALTTSQMKSSSSFTGWDFTNTWMINEGNDYPRLKWENQ